ncbi:MAG: superoxide dismutase [Mangrovibacterium sp.]
MSFKLPELGYAYHALEPAIDARTMEIHHTKHHAAYLTNLNNAISGTPLDGESIESILSDISKHSVIIRNNAGGFYNHSLFWDILTPGGANTPKDELAKKIQKAFGSFDAFKEAFANAAATRFGSGWAWLIKQGDSLFVSSTANQDNPLMDTETKRGIPILGLDVWEHAYYLNYQNRRPDYIKAFFSLINWDKVSERYHS